MANIEEALDAVTAMMQEVLRDPQSERASAAIERVVDDIYRLLDSPQFRALVLLVPPERRRHVPALLAQSVERLFHNLRSVLSVAFQLYELGSHATWVHSLVEAMARLAGALNFLGLKVEPFTLGTLPVPPMVVAGSGDPDGPSRFNVLTERVRYPQLAPYVDTAMLRARATELEDGRWVAELDDDFGGVWADGASRQESLTALADVLHEWLIIKAEHGDDDLPVLGHLDPRALIPVR
jgi:predicted RNase H-like HicB family nuclease